MSDVEERTETSVDLGRQAATRAESRMLIDGELVAAASGEEFDNVSPATGLVLGRTAAAQTTGHGPGHRRGTQGLRRDRLVDEPRTAQAVPGTTAVGDRSRQGRPARGADRRGRLPGDDDTIRPTRLAAGGGTALSRPADRRVRVGTQTRRWRPVRRPQRANRRQGTGRRRRRDHAVQLSDRGHPQQARSGACDRQYRCAQTGSEHAVERHAAGPVDRRAHRHPRGRGERRPDAVQRGRRTAGHRSPRRHDLVHRLHRPSASC